MKRFMILFGALAALAGNVGADEAGEFRQGPSVGSGWAVQTERYGGRLEVALPLVEGREGLFLRGALGAGGYGGGPPGQRQADWGGLVLDARLAVGGRVLRADHAVRSYGYLAGEFGMFAADSKAFHAAPFMAGLGFGGGFEFQFTTIAAFFVECGGSLNFVVGGGAASFSDLGGGSPALCIGWRNYF